MCRASCCCCHLPFFATSKSNVTLHDLPLAPLLRCLVILILLLLYLYQVADPEMANGHSRPSQTFCHNRNNSNSNIKRLVFYPAD